MIYVQVPNRQQQLVYESGDSVSTDHGELTIWSSATTDRDGTFQICRHCYAELHHQEQEDIFLVKQAIEPIPSTHQASYWEVAKKRSRGKHGGRR